MFMELWFIGKGKYGKHYGYIRMCKLPFSIHSMNLGWKL
jgi:hypothetical protein